jgi:MFS family permease
MMKAQQHSFYTPQFLLLCFSNFLFSSSFTMMLPELNGYLTQLGGADYKGYIIALFTLMAGISRPFSGKLTDTIGRVPVMVFGSLVCVVCSLLYPLLTSVAAFLLLRFLHGFSTGFKPTATSAYGADVVHESRRGEALGALSIGYTLGMSISPMAGSFLVETYGYAIMFYVSSALAFGSVLILYNIKETLHPTQPFRWQLLRIQRSELFERTALKPATVMLLLAFAYGCMLIMIPEVSVHLGMKKKGLFYACYTITALLVRFIAGKKSDEYGRIPVLIVASIIMCCSMLLLAFTDTIMLFLATACLFGFSHGLYGPTIAAWTVDLCSVENRGKAVSSMYIALEAGIGLGALLSAKMYNNQPSHFAYAFGMAAAMSFVCLLLLLLWRAKSATNKTLTTTETFYPEDL